MNNFQELTDFLDKYHVKYIIHSDCVEVEGVLFLHKNNLTFLPESFGNLQIGGSLWLHNNKLESLPKSFGNLKIGGGLCLDNNNLISLPELFGNLKIGGGLRLSHNKLESLPESFGNLQIGGYLWLNDNKLESLPESFGNLKIGSSLWLSKNKLEFFSESFGNLKIGGGLYLHENNFTSFPESFVNLKIGGSLYLSHNKLKSHPSIPKMNQTIEEDWCYIDGIVREIVSKKILGELTLMKTPFDYIVGKDNTWAHGRTIEEATQDYHFKLIKANPDALKDIDLDKPLSHEEAINVYRTVTGACRAQIRQWMSGKVFPDQITIREIINLTQSAYGGKEFKEFFLP